MQAQEARDAALAIVLAVWRGIDWDKIGNMRRMGIYEELTSKTRSSAHNRDLHRCLDRLARKMGSNPVDSSKLTAALALPEDDQARVLDCMRNEATALILSLREVQAFRKEAAQERQQQNDGQSGSWFAEKNLED